jgi:hypothetical protein
MRRKNYGTLMKVAELELHGKLVWVEKENWKSRKMYSENDGTGMMKDFYG